MAAALTPLSGAGAQVSGTNPPAIRYDDQSFTVTTPSNATPVFRATGNNVGIEIQHRGSGTGVVLTRSNAILASAVAVVQNNALIDFGTGAKVNGSNIGTTSPSAGLNGLLAESGGDIVGADVSVDIISPLGRGIVATGANSVITLTGTTTVSLHNRNRAGTNSAYGIRAASGGVVNVEDLIVTVDGYNSGGMTYAADATAIAADNAAVHASGAVGVTVTGEIAVGVSVMNNGTADFGSLNADIHALSGNAYGVELITGGTLAVTGTAAQTVTADTADAYGYSVDNGALTLRGGGATAVTGANAYGLALTNGSADITDASLTVSGGTEGVGLVINGAATADFTGATVTASHTGVRVETGTAAVTLTDSTLKSLSGQAFVVADGASLTVTADNSHVRGASAPGAGSVLDLELRNGSEWEVMGDSLLTGLINNASHIRFPTPAGGVFTTVTTASYAVSGGHLHLNVKLGDETSPGDRLVVGSGGTSGSGVLHVNNAGGSGALTGGDGIAVVTVSGPSNAAFTLAGDYTTGDGLQAVVGGAYAYTLQNAGDGNWYLHSQMIPTEDGGSSPSQPAPRYQPFSALAEAYSEMLAQAVTGVDTFKQRLGGRYETYRGSPTPAAPPAAASAYLPAVVAADMPLVLNTPPEPGHPHLTWAEVRGSGSWLKTERSTTGVSLEYHDWELRSGFDGILAESDGYTVLAGINVAAGESRGTTESRFGNGTLDSIRQGVGATLTWYNDSGAYIDLQAKALVFHTDAVSDDLGVLTDRHHVLAGVLSVEAGQDVKLGENWFVTPQLQLIWGDYHAKVFYDGFGTRFELLETPEVRGRLGLAAEHRLTDVDARGGAVTTRFYGIGNLYYDFMGRNGIDVSGTPLTREQDELWGGVGLGASRDWLDGAYRVFTEADARAGLEHFADSYSITGRLGVAARW